MHKENLIIVKIDLSRNQINEVALLAHAKSIRQNIVRMIARNGQGYLQQGLGAADLFTYLYFAEALIDPLNPNWAERDRIFLSTAHNSAVFHATLAERGFFEHSRLETYTQDGSELEINVSALKLSSFKIYVRPNKFKPFINSMNDFMIRINSIVW